MEEYNLAKKYLATRFERANPVAEIKQIYIISKKKKWYVYCQKIFKLFIIERTREKN